MVNYRWINLFEIPVMNSDRIVLFGAGHGSEEFLDYLGRNQPDVHVLWVTDNDASIHGKSFYGHEIIPPDRLKDLDFDKIVVTTVSGRDAISNQLENMGYRSGRHYIVVGRYPVATNVSWELIEAYCLCDPEALKGSNCLVIGPGGNLGLEVLLYCYGADRVSSIDKYRFGINYPDITNSFDDYNALRIYMDSIMDSKLRQRVLKRFESLFIQRKNRYFLSENKIKFIYPMDICNLSFEDSQFDFIFSSGVLEHVKHPMSAVAEVMRVLKKNGVILNKVVTRDHRSFSKAFGYHPFSFRQYSTREWDQISLKKFYQNRVLPIEWKRLFMEHGLKIGTYEIEEQMKLDKSTYEEFHPEFHQFSMAELSEINCIIAGKRE